MNKSIFLSIVICIYTIQTALSQDKIKILNFYGDNGFIHKSQEVGVALIDSLSAKNNWEVITTNDLIVFTLKNIRDFNVIIFNNNCGYLRNTNIDKKSQYEGFWARLSDENQPWTGSRNGLERGLWNKNSPLVFSEKILKKSKFNLLIEGMGEGADIADIEFCIRILNNISSKNKITKIDA